MGTIYKRAGVKTSGTSILLLSKKSSGFRKKRVMQTSPEPAQPCCAAMYVCCGAVRSCQLARHSFPCSPCLTARAAETTLLLSHTGPTPAPGEAFPWLGFPPGTHGAQSQRGRQQGCRQWGRALKSPLLVGVKGVLPAAEPLLHRVQTSLARPWPQAAFLWGQRCPGIPMSLWSHLHRCAAQVSTPEQASDWGDWAKPAPTS